MGLLVQAKEDNIEKKEEETEMRMTALQNKCMYCGSAFADSVQLTHHLMKELKERAMKREDENGDVHHKKEEDVKKEFDLKKEVIVKTEDQVEKVSRSTYFRRRRRIKEMTGPNNYRCVYCGLLFANNMELRTHKQRYKDSNLNLICPESDCSATFSNKGGRQVSDSLKAHMNKHLGLSFVCPNCGKIFFSNGHLKVHLKSHMKEESNNCEQCPQAFISNEGLQRHIKMHDSQRKFSCKDCNLRFKALYVLQNHIKLLHEDILEFIQCKLCEKIFKTDLAVQAHTRTVHDKERNYECTECSYKFFSNCKLSLHFRRKHMKSENMKLENMKIENMKIENMKIENMKIENMKTENMKTENMNIENMKIETY